MALITKVKAGGINSLSDARYFAGMGVDWLGFSVNPDSENFVSLSLYKDIAGWISGPQRVIEIGKTIDISSIQQLVNEYNPDFIQVDFDLLPLANIDKPIFAVAQLSRLETLKLKEVASQIKYLILNDELSIYDSTERLADISKYVDVLITVQPGSNIKKHLSLK